MIIIWGSHYLGEKNRRVRYDVCEFCRQESTLVSHEVWKWGHLYWIPLIPLQRLQIINKCTLCGKLQHMTVDGWKGHKTAAIDEAELKTRNAPDNVDAWIALHRAYLDFDEWERADEVQAKVSLQFANDPRFLRHIGSSLMIRGDGFAAQQFLSRAEKLDPTPVPPPSSLPQPVKPGPPQRVVASAPARNGLREFGIIGLIVLVVIVALVGVNFYRKGHRTVYVVSGLAESVDLEIDGKPLPPAQPSTVTKIDLAEGRHQVRFRVLPVPKQMAAWLPSGAIGAARRLAGQQPRP